MLEKLRPSAAMPDSDHIDRTLADVEDRGDAQATARSIAAFHEELTAHQAFPRELAEDLTREYAIGILRGCEVLVVEEGD